MKPRIVFRLLLLFLLAILSSPISAQKQNEVDDVRDAFIVSRKKGEAYLVHRPPGSASKAAKLPNKPKKSNGASGANRIGKTNSPIGSLGLGYTVYQRDPSGNPVRVSQSQAFRGGDAVRLVVESNTDGFLYVFYTENDGLPQMIFPDHRLKEGRNAIQAHVPYEVPSSREANPALRWFRFDEKPATERLYLVVTKDRLTNVPIGADLLSYCRKDAPPCPWRPAETDWSQIARIPDGTLEGKSGEFGQLLAKVEREAIERGLGLGLDAPGPAVIRMSKSPAARELLTVVELIHK
ncbi:MAG: DUF4384 domain-containing protein [Blastocatellia bacterium]